MRRRLAAAALGGLVIGALGFAAANWLLTSAPVPTPRRLGLTVEEPVYTVSGPPLLAISADGNKVVYTTAQGLVLRDLEHLEARFIPGTEGGNTPVFSPDGRWLAFQGGGAGLAKVNLSGGPVQTLCQASVRGLHWGANDVIVYGDLSGGLKKVSALGGDCTEVTTRGEGQIGHYRPFVLPDGRNVLFTVWAGSLQSAQLAIVSLDGGEPRLLGVAGTYPRYVDTGHIVFARDASLWGVPFDLGSLQVIGQPVPLLEGLRVEGSSGAAQFDVAAAGSLVYVPGGTASGMFDLVWVAGDGSEEPVGMPGGSYYDAVVSPDGTRIALTVSDGVGVDVHVWGSARSRLSRVTFDPAEDHSPWWTPDGSGIAYASSANGGGMHLRASDGTGEARRIGEFGIPWGWTEDGGTLAQTNSGPTLVQSDGTAAVLLGWDANQEGQRPVLSPDRHWLAYQARSGPEGNQIYVRPFPAVGEGQWQVSDVGGVEPRWSHDGRELYYRSGFDLWGVSVTTEPTFATSAPRRVVDGRGYLFLNNRARTYDVASDGRFLLSRPHAEPRDDAGQQLPGMVLVLDWVGELQRLVPTSR